MSALTRTQALQTSEASRQLVAAALDQTRMIGADDGEALAITILETAYAMIIAVGFRDRAPDVDRVVSIAQGQIGEKLRVAFAQMARQREGVTVQ